MSIEPRVMGSSRCCACRKPQIDKRCDRSHILYLYLFYASLETIEKFMFVANSDAQTHTSTGICVERQFCRCMQNSEKVSRRRVKLKTLMFARLQSVPVRRSPVDAIPSQLIIKWCGCARASGSNFNSLAHWQNRKIRRQRIEQNEITSTLQELRIRSFSDFGRYSNSTIRLIIQSCRTNSLANYDLNRNAESITIS